MIADNFQLTGGLLKSLQKSETVYVSSSMFTDLDPIKLSTQSIVSMQPGCPRK